MSGDGYDWLGEELQAQEFGELVNVASAAHAGVKEALAIIDELVSRDESFGARNGDEELIARIDRLRSAAT